MFNFFFKKKKTQNQLISVVELPASYIFETFFNIETGLWIRSDFITVSEKNIDEACLNNLILKHLDYSKNVKESDIDFKKLSENYKKITGLSSLKKQMNNSKCIQIYRDTHTITFTPTKNGGTKGDDRGYSEIADQKIIVEKNTKDLYRYLFQCLDNCE